MIKSFPVMFGSNKNFSTTAIKVATVVALVVFTVLLVALALEQPVKDFKPDNQIVINSKVPITPSKRPPGQILDLTDWKLALPVNTAHKGNPDEITQPELASFVSEPFFDQADNLNAVVFRANAGGSTTKNSHYPRSELREMTAGGTKEARWSNSSGSHVMEMQAAITHLPSKKPEVVAAQIHDDKDDIIMVRLERNHLFVQSQGKNIGDLDNAYKLGDVFTVKIVAENGHIKVFYNGVAKVDYTRQGSDYYFKAGCYTQSNTSRGDKANAYGEVVIFSLKALSH